jgi:hypothetical protein
MCSLHYQRWRRHGSADITLRAANGTSELGCSIDYCGYVDPHGLVHGLCRRHYQQEKSRLRKYGIAERDNWTCGICRKPVVAAVQWPDPGQATLDHIVPVSKGGCDDPANLRLAHMGCNRSRGNRMEAHASP